MDVKRSLLGNYDIYWLIFKGTWHRDWDTKQGGPPERGRGPQQKTEIFIENRPRGICGFHISLLFFFYSFLTVVSTWKQNILGQQLKIYTVIFIHFSSFIHYLTNGHCNGHLFILYLTTLKSIK